MGNTSNRRQHSSKKTRNTSRNRKSKQTPEASNTERREQIRDMTTSSAPESNQSARDEPAESTANDPASRKQSPQQQIGSSMTAPFQLGGNPSRQQETRPEWHDRYVYEPFGPFQSAPHSAPQNLPRPPIESPEFSMKLFSRAREHIRTQKSRLEMEPLLESRRRNDERLTTIQSFKQSFPAILKPECHFTQNHLTHHNHSADMENIIAGTATHASLHVANAVAINLLENEALL